MLANINMKYFPFENITYETKLDLNEIKQRLSEVIEPKRNFRMTGVFGKNNHKLYEGRINGNEFNITRIIGYGNSFLPIIKGKIEKGFNGTKVNVKMSLQPFIIFFMFIWFVGIGIGCFAALAMMFNEERFEPMSLIPFGMLIFGYAIVTGGFKYESIKSKKYLAQLFEARN